jgi:prepilin-type processing-associated H-X9-DG protein
MANVEYGAMPRLMPMPGTWGAVMREANATVRQRQREQVPMADADKLRLRAERMAHGGQHTPMLMVDGHLSDGTVLPSDSSVAVRRSPVRGGGGLLRGAAGIPASVAAHHLSPLGIAEERLVGWRATIPAADGRRWLPRGLFSTPSAPPVAPFHARIAELLGSHGAFVPREVPAVGHGPRR